MRHCKTNITGVRWPRGSPQDLDRMRCGTLIGTAMGGMTSFANAVEALELQSGCCERVIVCCLHSSADCIDINSMLAGAGAWAGAAR